MRSSAARASTGPASLTTSRRIGVRSIAAIVMPISAPSEIPTQATSSTFRRARSVIASAT